MGASVPFRGANLPGRARIFSGERTTLCRCPSPYQQRLNFTWGIPGDILWGVYSKLVHNAAVTPVLGEAK